MPNRHDPFLRPVLTTALQALGLYGYGYETGTSPPSATRLLAGDGCDEA